MVTTYYPPYHFGGDAVYVRSLSRALVAAGHSVEVVHCEDAFRLRRGAVKAAESPDTDDGVVVRRLHSRLGPISPLVTHQTGIPGLKRDAFRREPEAPYDVIHYHNISLVGGPGVLALGEASLKLYTMHEHWLVCPTHVLWKNRRRPCDRPQCLRCSLLSGRPPQPWRYTGLLKRSLDHVDLLLSPSAFTAQRHREAGIVRPIQVLPTFASMDAPIVAPAPVGRPHFVYAGRLTRSKGVLDMIETFRGLPRYDLTIAGEGELRGDVRRAAEDIPHIRVVGPLPHAEVIRLYQQATATILPSVGPEVFPLAVLESMACGTPVIVRQAGGSSEAVDATGGGLVYRTAAELGGLAVRIASDPGLRAALAQKARTGYEQRYTPRRHLDRYLELIETTQGSEDSGSERPSPRC